MLSTIHLFVALGAAAVFLCLPHPGPAGHRWRIAGLIVGLAALAGLATDMSQWLGPQFEGRAFFIVFASLSLFAAVRVVSHPKPVYSALYFVIVVLSVTALCILASAEFLGLALVIVYAGAILVTYVFVIMLAQQAGIAPYDKQAREPFAAVALGFILAAVVGQAMISQRSVSAYVREGKATYRLASLPPSAAQMNTAQLASLALNQKVGNVRAVGAALMTTYVVAVEVAGVLLLVAMVGAIAIAQKRIEPEALTPAERQELTAQTSDPHRLGRQAVPF